MGDIPVATVLNGNPKDAFAATLKWGCSFARAAKFQCIAELSPIADLPLPDMIALPLSFDIVSPAPFPAIILLSDPMVSLAAPELPVIALPEMLSEALSEAVLWLQAESAHVAPKITKPKVALVRT